MSDEIVKLPVNGILDLHNFQPSEVADLVFDYLHACQKADILQVRVIHGKGIGNLRRTVHARLEKMSIVKSYELAGSDAGHWGATLVMLHKISD
jgi:DNA-nicking Smr family endonuclease